MAALCDISCGYKAQKNRRYELLLKHLNALAEVLQARECSENDYCARRRCDKASLAVVEREYQESDSKEPIFPILSSCTTKILLLLNVGKNFWGGHLI